MKKQQLPTSAQGRHSVSRRDVLAGGGALAIVAGLPSFALSQNSAMPTQSASQASSTGISGVTERLGAYMSEAASRPLPREVAAHTKQHILDTISAMISGVGLAPGRLALKFAAAMKNTGSCSIVGSRDLCGPLEAAIANGMLSHSDETDDSHAPSHTHPGCSIIPATLASGEHFNISGEHFIRAVALGYDVGTRVTTTLGSLHFQIQTHHSTHSIGGTFGSTAAACCAARLNAQQMQWALDYAAQQASGIAAWQRDTEHISKSLVFAGWPARNGVMASLLVQLGATGVNDIFAGPDNFLTAFAPQASPETLIDKLGQRFEVSRTNIKKWTVGSPIQAPLDALQELMQSGRLHADDITRLVVRLGKSEAKTVNDREMPDISLQHLLAVMLLDGTVTFAAAHDQDRMKDPAIARQRAKITLTLDDELERLYPKRAAIVDLTLGNGKTISKRVEAVRGTADNPMTEEEVAAKALDLIAPRLGKDRAVALISQILRLESAPSVRALRTQWQPS